MLEKVEFKGIFQGTEKALPHQKYQKTEDREAVGGMEKGRAGWGQRQTAKQRHQTRQQRQACCKKERENCSQISES